MGTQKKQEQRKLNQNTMKLNRTEHNPDITPTSMKGTSSHCNNIVQKRMEEDEESETGGN